MSPLYLGATRFQWRANQSATLASLLGSPGCHKLSKIGSRNTVNTSAKATPTADITANTRTGCKSELNNANTPAQVVTVVTKIARPVLP